MAARESHTVLGLPLARQLPAQSHQVPGDTEEGHTVTTNTTVISSKCCLRLVCFCVCDLSHLCMSCCVLCMDAMEASIPAMSFTSLLHREH